MAALTTTISRSSLLRSRLVLVPASRCWLSVWRTEQPPNVNQQPLDEDGKLVDDRPVTFTSSPAHRGYKAYRNWRLSDEEYFEQPKYGRPLFVVSALSFIAYCCFLREPNDVDKKLSMTLFEQVPHLEKPMLQATLQSFERQGMETADLRARLKELDELEAKAAKENPKPVSSNPNIKLN